MRFKLMLRGRGYLGAAGVGTKVDAADSASPGLDKRVYYVVPQSGGLWSTLTSGGRQEVRSGFISRSDYDAFKAQGVLMDSKARVENVRPPNYALYRVRSAASGR